MTSFDLKWPWPIYLSDISGKIFIRISLNTQTDIYFESAEANMFQDLQKLNKDIIKIIFY